MKLVHRRGNMFIYIYISCIITLYALRSVLETRRQDSEQLRADEKIILEWFVENEFGRVWTGCIWLDRGQ